MGLPPESDRLGSLHDAPATGLRGRFATEQYVHGESPITQPWVVRITLEIQGRCQGQRPSRLQGAGVLRSWSAGKRRAGCALKQIRRIVDFHAEIRNSPLTGGKSTKLPGRMSFHNDITWGRATCRCALTISARSITRSCFSKLSDFIASSSILAHLGQATARISAPT